ncbi:MAG: cytidylate kinase-like family protein [Bacteroidales bacterium]|nr:cytidylate kinase-like family protein [Bacteroidales bacterium]
MSKIFHLNIGRQIGSGGLEIAKRLGEIFNIKVYDKNLINMASRESGLDASLFERQDEKDSLQLNGSFSFSTFVEAVASGFGANMISSSNLFKIQSDVIRRIASKGSTIIVGRCADYILRDLDGCLNVFITADLKDKIERIRKSGKFSDVENLTDEKIADLIEKGDRKRASYYEDFSLKVWGVADSYDLCLNSSTFGIDGSVAIIEKYIKENLL